RLPHRRSQLRDRATSGPPRAHRSAQHRRGARRGAGADPAGLHAGTARRRAGATARRSRRAGGAAIRARGGGRATRWTRRVPSRGIPPVGAGGVTSTRAGIAARRVARRRSPWWLAPAALAAAALVRLLGSTWRFERIRFAE